MTRWMTALRPLALATLGVSALSGCGSSKSSSTNVVVPTAVATGPMSIKVLSASTRPVGKQVEIIFHVRTTGVALDAQHMGSRPFDHQGHIAVYLDRIPSSAYSKLNPADVVNVGVGRDFGFLLTPHWLKAAQGRHRFVLALARNDGVLYQVKPSSIAVTVKGKA